MNTCKKETIESNADSNARNIDLNDQQIKIQNEEDMIEVKTSDVHPKQIFQEIESQYEAYAFASMIMASLPFPPLPVCVNRGEDMEDGMASSFDLLQQAIMADQANINTTKKNDILIMQKKIEILKKLHEDMQKHYANASKIACDKKETIAQHTNTVQWIEQAYLIYTTHLRKYLLDCYPNCSSDLRFFSYEDVPMDHVLIDHAKSHIQSMILQANQFNDVAGNVVVHDICSNIKTYSDVIYHYACDLGSLPNE